MSGEFIDTNVLVYAHDLTAGLKRDRALALVERLVAQRRGLLSTQVLGEFFVTVTRKLPRPLSWENAAEILADFGSWPVYRTGVADLLEAARIARSYGIHFWDSLILQAAARSGASVVWTEDLNHGQDYEGIAVRNPFL